MTTIERAEYQNILEEQGEAAAQQWVDERYPEPVIGDQGEILGWKVDGRFEEA